jgi:hypothetical protein
VVDGVRQTTTLDGIHIWGWTADLDAPRTALTVRITIDGSLADTRAAELARPDVGAALPHFGAQHGYDVVLPASAAGHTVCVTAVSVGGGADAQSCRVMDDVIRFEARRIDYDQANAVMVGSALDSRSSATVTNGTSQTQTTQVTREMTYTNTQSWSDTLGISVTAETTVKAGILIFEGGIKVTVGGSYAFTRNGSTQSAVSWTWSQPVVAPPRSIIVATSNVTRYTVVAPYTLTGDFVYRSGVRAAGTTTGTFVGTNNYDFNVDFAQFDLDGTPSARPVTQPEQAMRIARN